MQSVATGSDSAFRRLFDRHGARVLGYCRRLMGDAARGEDMAQNTWIKVIRASASYQGQGQFTAWLLSVARHTCLSEMRLQRHQVEISTDDITAYESVDLNKASVEDFMSQQESITELKHLVDRLPTAQRLALTLWLSEDFTYEQIAQELETSEAAVKALLFRARQSLQTTLKVPK